MEFVNLTLHVLNIQKHDGTWVEVQPTTPPARVDVNMRKLYDVSGVNIYIPTYGKLRGLPAQKDNTIYVVSYLALSAAPTERADVMAPGELIRNDRGQVVGCEGLKCK